MLDYKDLSTKLDALLESYDIQELVDYADKMQNKLKTNDMDTSKYYKKLEELTTSKALVGGAIVEIIDADDAENLIDEIISDYDDLVKELQDKIENYESIFDKINRLLP